MMDPLRQQSVPHDALACCTPVNSQDHAPVRSGKWKGRRVRETETGDRERQRLRGEGWGRGRERENSNSKTLFYKDCSLGSVKHLSDNYSMLSY